MKWRSRLSLVVTITALAAAVACGGNRPDPTDRVQKALKDANLKDVNVKWDSTNQVAHLTGKVPSAADKSQAEAVATQAVGTTGRVSDELVVEGMNEKTAGDEDGEIRDELHRMSSTDPTLKDDNITYDVKNGAVTITGQVDSAREKQRVTELARAVPGVTDVTNALKVNGEQPGTQTPPRAKRPRR